MSSDAADDVDDEEDQEDEDEDGDDAAVDDDLFSHGGGVPVTAQGPAHIAETSAGRWRFTGADEGVALVVGPDDSWVGVVSYRPGQGWDAWAGIEIGNYPSRREAAEAIAAHQEGS